MKALGEKYAVPKDYPIQHLEFEKMKVQTLVLRLVLSSKSSIQPQTELCYFGGSFKVLLKQTRTKFDAFKGNKWDAMESKTSA